MAGYEDVNDAEQLSRDPTFRLIGSEKIWDRGAALPSRLQTFETELLAEEGNFAGLARVNRELIGKAEGIDSPHRTVLDMDSTEIPVYGEQEQSAYNGHFESTCYHPLLLFNRDGDCLAAKLRPGNVHSAEGWEELLLPEVERQQRTGNEIAFRADAAFAKPEIYEALEERGVKYAIRIAANENLQRDIEELLKRPVGRPSKKPQVKYKGFLYQAASWKTARRVVAKVEYHPGELFPRVGRWSEESRQVISTIAERIRRAGRMKRAHKPATRRSELRRLGDRCRKRWRIRSCCLTRTDSATTERMPPGPASRARVTIK